MNVFVLLACFVSTCYGGFMAGGYSAASVNDPAIMKMAQFAFNTLSTQQNGNLHMERIVSAETQVVSGINYRLTIDVSDQHHQHELCQVIIYSQSWTNTLEVTDSKCTAKRSGSVVGMPGAPFDGSANDAQVQDLLNLAVDKINQQSNSMFRLSASGVTHVTKQVVAGMKYTFDVTLGISTCMNNQDKMGATLTACPLNSDSVMAPTTFHVVGLWQAWMNPQYQILSMTMV